ncbi:ParA family protein [Cryptosporangium japonicum]|uniref:Cellulose biosynthesis protein BcsQ n=1 Tax=Cryptosporangium japonicum TaxID=80872 RepID=A0ABN0UV86_9ACTN
MALIALASAKGSPGVTTAGLAFTFSWAARTVLAECDPSGGSVLAGYLQGQIEGGRGLMPLAVADLRHSGANDRLESEFWAQLVDLAPPARQRLLLAGLTDPAQSGTLAPLWNRFAGFFAQLEFGDPPFDVIVDCGRLAAPATPWPLLWAADAVLLVVRPTLPSVSAAVPTLSAIRAQLNERTASLSSLGLVLTGAGPYSASEVSGQLGAPVVATLPDDRRTADVLGFGGDVRLSRPLLRAAAGAEGRVRALIADHREQVPRRAVRRAVGTGG